MQARVAIALLRNRQAQTVLVLAVLMVVLLPVLVAAATAARIPDPAATLRTAESA